MSDAIFQTIYSKSLCNIDRDTPVLKNVSFIHHSPDCERSGSSDRSSYRGFDCGRFRVYFNLIIASSPFPNRYHDCDLREVIFWL